MWPKMGWNCVEQVYQLRWTWAWPEKTLIRGLVTQNYLVRIWGPLLPKVVGRLFSYSREPLLRWLEAWSFTKPAEAGQPGQSTLGQHAPKKQGRADPSIPCALALFAE